MPKSYVVIYKSLHFVAVTFDLLNGCISTFLAHDRLAKPKLFEESNYSNYMIPRHARDSKSTAVSEFQKGLLGPKLDI